MLSNENRASFGTLLDAIALQDDNADAPAIIYLATDDDPITITRALFQQNVMRYAHGLHALGIQPSRLVAIAHTQNLESIYTFWGAMMLGAIPSMYPTLTEKLDEQIYMSRMQTLVEHSEMQAILTTDDFAPRLAEIVTCDVIGSSQVQAALSADTRQTAYDADPNAIAFLQHSSGTTGLQKGVALSHEAVLNQLASYSDSLKLEADDVIVSWLPLYHDMGLIAGFMLPLVQGIPLVLMSPFDWVRHPAMLLQAIDDYNGTLCWLPNFAYNHCARRIRKRTSEGIDISSIRAFINCSEPVHHSSHLRFVERFAANGARLDQLSVSYAMAENTFAVTQTPVGEETHVEWVDRVALENEQYARLTESKHDTALAFVSCGTPIPNAEVRILGDDGTILDERHVGEVVVRSNCMLTGYYKRDDLNATLFEDGWYRTGDMGYIADGKLFISGRRKDLIITSGKNVYPNDLEAIVNTVEGVYPGRAVVFGVYDERDGTELIGVVAETEQETDEERRDISVRIRQAIGQQSSVTASYVTVVERGWLIKTSSGKIARNANRDKWLAER